jgi:hypothetical protein
MQMLSLGCNAGNRQVYQMLNGSSPSMTQVYSSIGGERLLLQTEGKVVLGTLQPRRRLVLHIRLYRWRFYDRLFHLTADNL